MITQINDNFYEFAPKLQAKLNETYGEFLEKCHAFFNNHREVSKNFATYIRDTDPLHPQKNETYFIIELDDHVLLDLTGNYDPKTDTITNASFHATLPYHETWHSEHFHSFTLTEEEKQSFLRRQKNIMEYCKMMGLRLTFDMLEFNPDRDSLPESVVVIEPNNGSIDELLKDNTMFSFMFVYYQYCLETKRLFEKIVDHAPSKKPNKKG